MRNSERVRNFNQELEAVFAECQQHINTAIRQYQKDISGAIKELKQGLTGKNRLSVN